MQLNVLQGNLKCGNIGALFQNGACKENTDHSVLYGAALDNVAQIKAKKVNKVINKVRKRTELFPSVLRFLVDERE